jgi:predicted nucleic acid-binding protein
MLVLDASAAVDWLLQTPAGERLERRIYARNETLHAPHLLDVEVAQVLRRLVRQKVITAQRATEAVHDLLDLRINRYPPAALLIQIWRLRDNYSAYDAAYLALAKELGAVLLTRDSGLAASRHTTIELF